MTTSPNSIRSQTSLFCKQRAQFVFFLRRRLISHRGFLLTGAQVKPSARLGLVLSDFDEMKAKPAWNRVTLHNERGYLKLSASRLMGAYYIRLLMRKKHTISTCWGKGGGLMCDVRKWVVGRTDLYLMMQSTLLRVKYSSSLMASTCFLFPRSSPIPRWAGLPSNRMAASAAVSHQGQLVEIPLIPSLAPSLCILPHSPLPGTGQGEAAPLLLASLHKHPERRGDGARRPRSCQKNISGIYYTNNAL